MLVAIIVLINLLIGLGLYRLIETKLSTIELSPATQHIRSLKRQKSMITELEKRYPLDIMAGKKVQIGQMVILYAYGLVLVGASLMILPVSFFLKFLFFIVIAGLPLVCLEVWRQSVIHKIDLDMLNFLQVLNVSFQVEEDIIKAFYQAESTLKNIYLKRLLSRFNVHVRKGLAIELAFRLLEQDAMHTYLKYIFVHFEESYFRRGNVAKLIANLEMEYTAIQIEINKRKLELKQERVVMLAMGGLLTIIGNAVMNSHDYLKSFYVARHWEDKILLIWFVTLFITLWVYMKGRNVDY